MSKTRIVLNLFAIALVFAASLFANAFPREKFEKKYSNPLPENFSEKICVVLQENADDSEKYAAKLLKKYLVKITDSNVEIISSGQKKRRNFSIYLKRNENSIPLSPLVSNVDACNEFAFRFEKNSIHIKYPDTKDAPANAVGEFLEKYCKAKFFAPSPLGEEIPKASNLKFKLGERRFFHSYKSRFLGIFQKDAHNYALLNGEETQLTFSSHNIVRIFDKKTAETHPEWAAMRKGKKQSYANSNLIQPDFLNLEMQAFAAEKTDEFFKKNPDNKIFSVEAADSGCFDDTPKSKKLVRGFTPHNYADYSNAVFPLANYVARSLEKKHPEKFVAQGAYLHTENPPDFLLKKNVFVQLATDTGNYFCENEKQKDIDLIKKWMSSGIKIFGRYDYNYGSPYFIPREISPHMAFSIKTAYELGARAYSGESAPVWAYDAHKMWLASKLLKDASLSKDEILDEFFSSFYKESSSHAREFFTLAKNAWNARTDTPGWLGLYKRESQAEIFSKETIAQMDVTLSRAENAAHAPKTKARLRELRMVFELTKAFTNSYSLKKSLWEFSLSETPEKILDSIEALKISEIRKKILLAAYERNTKYPKADFSIWEKINHINRAENLAEIALRKKPELASKVEEILGAEFLETAQLAATLKTKNIFKNSDFKNGFSHWKKYANESCEEILRIRSTEKGNHFVEISSQIFIGLNQRTEAREGSIYAAQIGVRGNLQIGDVCYLRLIFMDENGEILSSKYQQLPASNFENFIKMRILQKAPPRTKFATASVFVSTPNPQKTLNLCDFELLEYF